MKKLLPLLLFFFYGCGNSENNPPVKIMETQREQIDKAKGVEQTLQKEDEARRQLLDGQGESQGDK